MTTVKPGYLEITSHNSFFSELLIEEFIIIQLLISKLKKLASKKVFGFSKFSTR